MESKTPAPGPGATRKKKSTQRPVSAASIEDMVAPLVKLSDPIRMEEIKVAMQQVVTNATDADPFDRELVKERAKSILKSAGCSAPATLVRVAFASAKGAEKLAGQPIVTPDPDPWPMPVDGAKLLTEMRDAFKRYCILVPLAAEALALNALRTHVMDAFDFNPIMALVSPTKRCGKTRVLDVSECLVSRPMLVSGIRAAGIYRSVEEEHPTLLLDEADTYDNIKEKYRGILNSGHHRQSAWVEVQVPTPSGSWLPRKFSTYAPLFMGLIGTLPSTVLDRAVVIPMKRKKSTEEIALFGDTEKALLRPLKQQAIRWGLDRLDALKKVKPTVPTGLDDRAADCWRPLLAIAEAAGGPWPDLARQAALALSNPEQREDESMETYLLRALQLIFKDAAKLPTTAILANLNADPEAPWRRWNNGQGMDAHDLAKYLKPYGVRRRTLYWPKDDWVKDRGPHPKDGLAKGYVKSDLIDAWTRYLTDLTELTPGNNTLTSASSGPPTATTHTGDYLSGVGDGKTVSLPEWWSGPIDHEALAKARRDLEGLSEEDLEAQAAGRV